MNLAVVKPYTRQTMVTTADTTNGMVSGRNLLRMIVATGSRVAVSLIGRAVGFFT